jgi:hypothetical protein
MIKRKRNIDAAVLAPETRKTVFLQRMLPSRVISFFLGGGKPYGA